LSQAASTRQLTGRARLPTERMSASAVANTIQQYLREGLIDELHIAIAPVILGTGERLFEGINLRSLRYECDRVVASENSTHVMLRRKKENET